MDASPDTAIGRAEGKGGTIILARHGRPDADRTVRISAAGYRDWWAAYDTVGLHPEDVPPADIIEAAKAADILYCSGLPRALETARTVAPERKIIIDPVFIEAPLPPPPLPRFLQLKPPTWGVLARIAWWLGGHAGEETRQEAEARAERAADLVIESAASGETVMVFAHGWFNRMMRPALGRRGYVCVQDGGDVYWSFRSYAPRAQALAPGPALEQPGATGYKQA